MTPAVMTAKPMTNKFDDRFADSCHEVSSRSVITRGVSSFEEGHHNVLCHRLRRHPSKKVIT
jgi:hypothetical protein